MGDAGMLVDALYFKNVKHCKCDKCNIVTTSWYNIALT